MNKFLKRSFLICILVANSYQLHPSNQNDRNDNNVGMLMLGYAMQISLFVVTSSLTKIGVIYFEKQLNKCGLQTTPDATEINVNHTFDSDTPSFYTQPARRDNQQKDEKRYITNSGKIVNKSEFESDSNNYYARCMSLVGYSQCKEPRKLGGDNQKYELKKQEKAAKQKSIDQFKLDPIIDDSYKNTMQYQSLATLGLCPEFIEKSKNKFKQRCKEIEENELYSNDKKQSLKFNEVIKSKNKAMVAMQCTAFAGVSGLLAITGLIKHYYYKNK